jgi:small-conductance mechanosensitive channel
VTLRYVRLRDYDGNVHFVPNGAITTVVNMARGHAQAVMDVGVGYATDLDRAMSVMHQVATELRQDPVHSARIQGDLEMAGVDRWDDSAIVLRARFRVAPLEQWTVRREYLRRLKYAFDHAGIEIPFPQMALHLRRPSGMPREAATADPSPAAST